MLTLPLASLPLAYWLMPSIPGLTPPLTSSPLAYWLLHSKTPCFPAGVTMMLPCLCPSKPAILCLISVWLQCPLPDRRLCDTVSLHGVPFTGQASVHQALAMHRFLLDSRTRGVEDPPSPSSLDLVREANASEGMNDG